MNKPTLNVPGVDPARIECETHDAFHRVRCHGHVVAVVSRAGPTFYGEWTGSPIRDDCQKVMNAAIDHWRQTGRLFPEPPPEPATCVCGGKAHELPHAVQCVGKKCFLQATNVDQWNIIQAALKAAKK